MVAAAGSISLALRADAAVLYASNFNNDTITAYDANTGAFLGTPVTGGPESNGFNGVIPLDSGFLVAGQFSNNIVRYGANGAFLGEFDPGNTAGLDSPQGIALGPDGNVYAASAGNDEILKYDLTTGNFLGQFAFLGASGHTGPIGVTFGPDGNLYVTSFDNDQVIKLDGETGAVLGVKQGPAGFGFGPGAFGPDGNLYIAAVNLNTFAGSVYRYQVSTDDLQVFVPEGSGGLQSGGGIAFGPDGNLLASSLVFDVSFNDTGSTILKYDGQTAGPLGTFVGAGEGLNIPFFLATDIPEPSTVALFGIGAAFLLAGRYRRIRKL